jgi:hypothetical protein
MSRPKLLAAVATLKRDPRVASHMTSELEKMLACDDQRIWMRAVLAFAQSVAADRAILGDRQASAAALIAFLKPHLDAQAN